MPDKFFSILSSTKKNIYSDCIFIIYKILKNNTSFGIEREIIVDALSDYFENIEEKNVFIEEESNLKNSRDNSNFIIRKLKECGWIDIEITSNYKEIINLQDYAIAIIQTLDSIMNNEKLEYQGYVYTIYSILYGNENINKSIMLEQVYENTDKLISGLKSLNSNIKKYIEKIVDKKSAQEIIKLFFDDYIHNIIDKGYHRLKTSDNVSKFRPKIIEKLEEIKKDKETIKTICEELIKMEKEDNFESAYEKTINSLNDTINLISDIDYIINEIDRKNTQYIRSSVARIKLLLNSSKDLGGKINTILKYIADAVIENSIDIKEYNFEELKNIFSVFTQNFIDEKSLYISTEGKKTFKPEKINKSNKLSKEERENKIKYIKEKSKNRLSRKNIDEYVLNILKDKKVTNASMLPIENSKDFVKIIYILLYSKSKFVNYTVKKLNKSVTINNFIFNDFEIWRK
jgi:hypothetical protein